MQTTQKQNFRSENLCLGPVCVFYEETLSWKESGQTNCLKYSSFSWHLLNSYYVPGAPCGDTSPCHPRASRAAGAEVPLAVPCCLSGLPAQGAEGLAGRLQAKLDWRRRRGHGDQLDGGGSGPTAPPGGPGEQPGQRAGPTPGAPGLTTPTATVLLPKRCH